ncbi:COP9 signalosome complex subunit 4 [Psilocybe cubensis]|uniref:COP9 signalosome complex subunit 4 n=2 Tax=Psilocybe cubensis TaxID=181762 RepID=A0ACB8H674_PSICU|nr:COP9 signalosome complex subunit 4 [Psilocybe cubensis]KAH9482689.1 COP9 signalosome complex subunit 4 [Psilocybe cubensis]
MEAKLLQFSTLVQKDKGPAYISLIPEILSQSGPSIARDLHTLVDTVVNLESVGLVVGRQVLSELVKILGEGAIKDVALRKRVVEDTLSTIQPRIVSYEEQVNSLRFQLADLLEEEEEWSDAARVLMGISLDSGQRSIGDSEKLRVYVRIVRLLLEDEDSVQAETYYNRAALLVHSANDRETLLQFKLCQARISDYSRKFLEAASRYHELSYVGEIDEEERRHMLLAAVTCAVLAPAGPNRSRVLASLYRDERTADLPTYNILSKMFLDHILRPAEVKEFEKSLKPHQLAKISISSNDRLASAGGDTGSELDPNASTRTGPSTVLDRAVMEHNLLASSNIYNNITFRGLGALLDLTPGAAETMARKMIEQGRLRGSIDQVDKLIWFETNREEDDAQGKAGGLGDVEEAEDTGAPFTKRWDTQIRLTAAHVESIVQHLTDKGLVSLPVDSI